MSEAPASILVINVCRIGDTLLATPAIRALARMWPEARITVLGHPKRVEVIEHLPFVAEVGAITKQRALFRGWLQASRYDLAIVYGHDQALVRYALRVARQVVAFRQQDAALNARLYRCVEEAPAYSEHAVDGALRLIKALGIPMAGKRLSFALHESERRAAADRLAALGLEGVHPLIGLKIASFPTKAYRDWPVDHFVELCERIRALWPDAGFIIFGGPDERDNIAAAQRRIGGRCAAFSDLSLREAGAVMSLLDAYVGVDTGPTHIMGSFDIPIVAMFHCKLPRSLYGPLEHPCDFSLDHPRLGQACDETTAMAELSVDAVAGQLAAALRASRDRAGANSAR